MNHTLFMRMILFTVLAALTTACGQKGPLVVPPAAPADIPAPETAPATPAITDEAND